MTHTDHELWRAFRHTLLWIMVPTLLLAGCSRSRYRRFADEESYSIIENNAATPAWMSLPTVDIEPDPRSRLYDPTDTDQPVLPPPAPQLYGYELPELPLYGPPPTPPAPEEVVSLPPVLDDPQVRRAALPQFGAIRQMSYQDTLDPQPRAAAPAGVQQVPLPESAWQAVDAACLARMFEFATVRQEYVNTFGVEPTSVDAASARRLTLADIVELTMLNSRAYQTQKENLYQTALNLSLEQFDYDLKFTPSGNRTAANFSHVRSGGTSSETFSVPTGFQVDKMLASGGNLLARFANDVVLTFNGPSGFATDVSSELFLELTQTIFQRDATFESLTQAERNMVYAVRDFVRFRRELFAQIASSYYSLILTYRGIEIDSQDYFSRVRQYNQSEAEYRAGVLTGGRVGVDQFEQNTFSSRSSLISRCNDLESRLDALKLLIGLPPEIPINLDLTELEEITLRDQVAASGQLVFRARRQLGDERNSPSPDRSEILNVAIVLMNRMIESIGQYQTLGQSPFDLDSLRDLHARIQTSSARLESRTARADLERDRASVPPAHPLRLLQRTLEYVDSLLTLATRQRDYAIRLAADPAAIADLERRRAELQARFVARQDDLTQILATAQLAKLPALVDQATQLLADTEAVVLAGDAVTGTDPLQLNPQQEMQATLDDADRLLVESDQLLTAPGAGLVPVEVEMDDAMLTALVRRFDLMNQRGSLADDRRSIKLAADDLKSILNLNASQTIGTRTSNNRPFDFTFDESRTSLGATIDLPLNRRAQRNAYRVSLINYQAGLRALTQLEDTIKLAVRDDLRGLALQREQYQIAVGSAALAYGRVISAQLELQLGIPGVQPRDVIEAQDAYTVSLRGVASNHINYITSRIQLFLDMELLEVGDGGFWQPLYSEDFQPDPSYQLIGDALPAYGDLPIGPWYSKELLHILDVPTGISMLPADPQTAPLPEGAEPIAPPAPNDLQ